MHDLREHLLVGQDIVNHIGSTIVGKVGEGARVRVV